LKDQNNNTIQAFWVALSSLSGILISIVSASILSRYLSKADLGTYKQILYIYTSLSIVFSAGLPSVYSYYLPRYKKVQGFHIVKKISKLLFLCGAALSVTLFLGSSLIADLLANSDLTYGLQLFAIIPMLLFPTLGVEGVLVSYNMSYILPIYNSITKLLMLFCIVFPIILIAPKVEYAIFGWIISSFITLLITVIIIKIPFKNLAIQNSHLSYKTILKYSSPIMVASLAGVAINSADQFFISRYFGKEVFAEFSNGFIQLPFVGMVVGSASTVLMPKLSSFFSNQNDNNIAILDLWKSTIKKSALIIYPIIVLFYTFSNYFIIILYSDLYTESIKYFQLKLISNLFNVIIFAPILLSSGNSRFYMNLHMFIALLAWGGQFAAIMLFKNPIVSACVSVLILVITVFAALFKMKNILQTSFKEVFPYKVLLLILIHSVISIALPKVLLSLKYFDPIPELFKACIVFLLFIFILITTSHIFKLDYINVYKPILIKLKNYVYKKV